MKNNLDKTYTDLLQDILDDGVEKGDRTGTGTISVFGRQIRHDMSEGFPLLTTKKMAWKSMVVELLWFLRGETNVRPLVLQGCNIWNGDAYKYYKNHTDNHAFKYPNLSKNNFYGLVLTMEQFIEQIKINEEFAEDWGDLGPIYGKQWRSWKTFIPYDVTTDGCKVITKIIDQFSDAIDKLKNNPDSRRIMVNSWNVGDLDKMKLPPCHYGYQFWTRELTQDEISKVAIETLSTDKYLKYLEYLEIIKQMEVAINIYQDFEKASELKKEREVIKKEFGNLNLPSRGVSLMWNQRSVDTFLGLPFNIASYGLLLQVIAQHVNMIPLELIANLGDTHIYSNHLEQSKEQIGRDGFTLPKVKIKPFKSIEELTFEHFELIDYQSYPRIKAPLSN